MNVGTELELEERLSRPSAADIAAVAALRGDLLILGVRKMGSSLARLARRAADQAQVKLRVLAVARFSDKNCAIRGGRDRDHCLRLAPASGTAWPSGGRNCGFPGWPAKNCETRTNY